MIRNPFTQKDENPDVIQNKDSILVYKCTEILKKQDVNTRADFLANILSDPDTDSDMKSTMLTAFTQIAKDEGAKDNNKALAMLRKGVYTTNEGITKVITVAGLLTATTTTILVAGVSKVTHDAFMTMNPLRSHAPIFEEIDKLAKELARIDHKINQNKRENS